MMAYVCNIFPGIFGMLIIIVYVGVIIFMISLAVRLVRAVERIADKFKPPVPTES